MASRKRRRGDGCLSGPRRRGSAGRQSLWLSECAAAPSQPTSVDPTSIQPMQVSSRSCWARLPAAGGGSMTSKATLRGCPDAAQQDFRTCFPNRPDRKCRSLSWRRQALLRQTPFWMVILDNNGRRPLLLVAMMLVAAATNGTPAAGASCCGEKPAELPSSCCSAAAESQCSQCASGCRCEQHGSEACCCGRAVPGMPARPAADPLNRWGELLESRPIRVRPPLNRLPIRGTLAVMPDADYPAGPPATVLFCTWLK